MNQKLCAVVMPNRSLRLEWGPSEEPVNKCQKLLQEEIHRRFLSDFSSFLLFLGFSDAQVSLSDSLEFWRNFTRLFAEKLRKTQNLETLRHRAKMLLEEEELVGFLEGAPLMTGSEYLDRELIESIWAHLNQGFSRSIKSCKGTVEEFIHTYSADVHLVGRVFFHLVENRNEDGPFAFLATYSAELDQKGRTKHFPLKMALQQYGKNSAKLLELLTMVHMAAKEGPFLADLLESGELFHPLAWTEKEAFAFLQEVACYENSGILCRIPDWWKKGRSPLTVNVSIGDSQPSHVGMDAILNFDPRLYLGGVPIPEKEARRLLRESEGLAFIKNRWVTVDHEKLKQALDAYEKAKKLMKNGLSLGEALRFQLTPQSLLKHSDETEIIEISHGKWLESVFKKLRQPEMISSVKPGKGFKAKLRPYQQKGLNWLTFLNSLGFGACLADDMGLGKTIQILAFLNVIKSQKPGKASLLVIPASLLSNWGRETDRFAPAIKYFMAHPDANPENKVEFKGETWLDGLDLVITTYAMAQKYEWIGTYSWNHVILDEAQAIKNPGAKQTRAIKKLSARNKIVLTGTPIENRITDLWSLFDFINPGLLGNVQEFSVFSKNLKKVSEGYSHLRRVINPYILRRLKTDKSVISDLPDKVEMKTYATLSKKQVFLYQKMVEELKGVLEKTEGIQRKGMVLTYLMKFKQLCNHPDQYIGTGNFEEKNSGKFGRLREICETIYEKRERVLIFTQFKEMTEPLADFLSGIFEQNGLVLHGSVPVGKRKKIVETFQGDTYVPYMVLSLKAGGVGLNLTAANHVVHFDRWWNPAVENQATDRAFRIGQKKKVIAHKFLTQGTIEEKIDQMLEEKSRLSLDIIQGSGEAWITEMDNKELLNLFKFGL
ncbi:helicase SNF2 [Candidatus Nitromaritima sp. SCGC AAA799-A02]|nr:helicase SNF2 [Candidatus Nitromaritima sp. SCGC AAA799-A02]